MFPNKVYKCPKCPVDGLYRHAGFGISAERKDLIDRLQRREGWCRFAMEILKIFRQCPFRKTFLERRYRSIRPKAEDSCQIRYSICLVSLYILLGGSLFRNGQL